MKILLTNDDGYAAPGILALYKILKSRYEVVLVAPNREKSASGHSITLKYPMGIEEIDLGGGEKGYAVDGTPADCVKLALSKIFPRIFNGPPDLVVSGINPGCNVGVDINYSGTAAAAREGALNGLSSIAVSIKTGKAMDFINMARFTADLAHKVVSSGLPSATFLNVNAPDIPLSQVSGVKITRQSLANLTTVFEEHPESGPGRFYQYGALAQGSDEPGTDVHALAHRNISITPITCDTTDYKTVEEIRALELSWGMEN